MDKMTYKRKVDKAEIPICNIMGVNIFRECIERRGD